MVGVQNADILESPYTVLQRRTTMPFGNKTAATKAVAPVKKAFGVKAAPAPVSAPVAKAAGFGKKAAPPVKAAPKATFKGVPAAKKRDSGGDEEVDLGGVTSGWGGAAEIRAQHSDYANRLKLKDGESIVLRFLEDGPYANVATHWFKRQGQRSFLCPGAKTCPLCAVGDKPNVTNNFNVAVLTDGDPVLHSWEVGKRLFEDIKKAAAHVRYKPLSSRFYTLEREGSGVNDTKWKLNVVKRVEDIADDFPELNVPDDDELAALDRYTAQDAAKQKSPLATLQEMAEELTGGGYDPDNDEDED
jgi:hypothetical protein